MFTFDDRIETLCDALEGAAVPFAFGGATAYAFHVRPRATTDIDMNVFVHESASGPVLDLLATLGVAVSTDARMRVQRDGQDRLPWDGIILDVFFATFEFLDEAGRRVERVPFNGRMIPILSAEDLTICKVTFNRPKDWLDLERLVALRSDTFDFAYAHQWLRSILGDGDERIERFNALRRHNGTE